MRRREPLNISEAERDRLIATGHERGRRNIETVNKLWDETSTEGHPDPEVRDFSRAWRNEHVWKDQMYEHDNTPEYNLMVKWSGWPVLNIQVAREGNCEDCRWSYEGRGRGYDFPCVSCKTATLSLFTARA